MNNLASFLDEVRNLLSINLNIESINHCTNNNSLKNLALLPLNYNLSQCNRRSLAYDWLRNVLTYLLIQENGEIALCFIQECLETTGLCYIARIDFTRDHNREERN